MKHQVIVWNVERLLAPSGSTLARALDATEASGWTRVAYREKVRAVAGTLRAAFPDGPPAIAVLIEVENATVVRDLLRATGWRNLVDVAPADERMAGYDVAILYDPDQVVGHRDAASYNIGNRYATRDVLDVTLDLPGGKTLRMLAAHWASRRMSNAEPLRIAAAWFTATLLDRIMKFPKEELFDRTGKPRVPSVAQMEARWLAPLIVAGDFNDNPWDTSVRLVGDATYDQSIVTKRPRFPRAGGTRGIAGHLALRPHLFNPTWLLPMRGQPPGTTRYAGEWHLLDQMLLSPGLIGHDEPRYEHDSLRVFAPREVQVGQHTRRVTDRAGAPLPFSLNPVEGVSDHLPIIAEFSW